ncbi:hypothetical protein ACVWW3_006439 [Bradyrhizobium sp. LM2.9]
MPKHLRLRLFTVPAQMHRKGRTAIDVYRAEASAGLTDDRDIVDDCYPNAFVHKAYRRFDMADPYANVRLDPNFSKLLFRDRAVGRTRLKKDQELVLEVRSRQFVESRQRISRRNKRNEFALDELARFRSKGELLER